MKFAFVIAILAALLAVEAVPIETNAQRMARGLPPLYPQNLKRGTLVDVARRGEPSKRATPVDVVGRGEPSKRATPARVARRGEPSGRSVRR